jgi:beta-glucosidase
MSRYETAETVNMGAFPEGFLWGTATSSYQIEGAVDEDGRGPSIWDTFSHTIGRTREGDTGDVACDHYHRWADDVALMADLRLTAYRFSIAWPRVQPEGRGPANRRGLDFYDRLVDGLLANGITPMVTLYHWDLPRALEDDGGWRNRDTAGRFADYAEVVVDALGDRVPHWTTVNEPWCAAFLGHLSGEHAPGLTDPAASVRATHHLLLGHGLAAQALRAGGAERVAITLNLYPVSPATDGEQDAEAALLIDGLHNRLFLDPVLVGQYPVDVHAHLDKVGGLDVVRDGDLAQIGPSVDELGVNYYTRLTVRAGGEARTGPARYPGAGHVELLPPPGEQTEMGWAVDPGGLTDILARVHQDYPGTPLYIHENGAAFDDDLDPDGRIEDPARIRFLAGHFQAAADALTQGVDLRGYCVWSLLDNFEWAEGYAKRFGIVYVDYDSLRRIPKASAHWLRDRIAEHRTAH